MYFSSEATEKKWRGRYDAGFSADANRAQAQRREPPLEAGEARVGA